MHTSRDERCELHVRARKSDVICMSVGRANTTKEERRISRISDRRSAEHGGRRLRPMTRRGALGVPCCVIVEWVSGHGVANSARCILINNDLFVAMHARGVSSTKTRAQGRMFIVRVSPLVFSFRASARFVYRVRSVDVDCALCRSRGHVTRVECRRG